MSKYQEIGGSRTFRPWKEWEIGEFIAGEYIKTSTDKFGKDNYTIKVDKTNIDGLKVGETVVLNSNGSLDYKMQDIEIGQEVMIEYRGQEKLTKGTFSGKEFHNVKVCVALGNSPMEDSEILDEDI